MLNNFNLYRYGNAFSKIKLAIEDAVTALDLNDQIGGNDQLATEAINRLKQAQKALSACRYMVVKDPKFQLGDEDLAYFTPQLEFDPEEEWPVDIKVIIDLVNQEYYGDWFDINQPAQEIIDPSAG